MPGRIRTLDETKQAELCLLVNYGCTVQFAAKHVGCSRATVYREACRNPDFAERLRRAEQNAHLHPVRTLQQAARDNWRAAAWLLERTCPDDYARKPANVVRIETVRDMVSRFLAVLEAELSDSPENQEVCLRLTRAIEETFDSVAPAAQVKQSPRLERQTINEALPAPQTDSAQDVADGNSRHDSPDFAE